MKKWPVLANALVIIILLTFISIAGAQEQAQEAGAVDEDQSTVEIVSGEVTEIGKDYISVVYNRDFDAGVEYEIMIPLDNDTGLKHKASLSEIKKGDLVSVEYLKSSKGKLKAKTVNFVQASVDALASKTSDDDSGGVPQQ